MAATLNKLSFLTADGVQAAFLQGWFLTGWDSAAKPDLPAGMIVVVGGYPYQVVGGNLTPSGTPADGPVYIKITPNPADSGATALAAFVVTWPATWSETYNGWYDGTDLYLNAFMTKAGANYASKGFWLNFREKKVSVVSDDVTIQGDVAAVNGSFTGTLQATLQLIPNVTSTIVQILTSTNELIPAGIYIVIDTSTAYFEIYKTSTWEHGAYLSPGAMIISDGTNFRFRSPAGGLIIVNMRKFTT